MINTTLWILAGFLSGYVIIDFINYYHYRIYNCNISNTYKYNILLCIVFFSFLRGYTGNDLVTNLKILVF
jgi:hypothetical protein